MEGEEEVAREQAAEEANDDKEVIEVLGPETSMTEALEEAAVAPKIKTQEDFFFSCVLFFVFFLELWSL